MASPSTLLIIQSRIAHGNTVGLLPKDYCKHDNLCVAEIKGSEEMREGKREEDGNGWKEKNIHRKAWTRKLKRQSMLRAGPAFRSSLVSTPHCSLIP